MKKILAASVIFLAAQTMTSLALAANVEILTQEACATAIKEISGKKLSATTYYVNGASKYRPGDMNYEITKLKFSHEEGLEIAMNGEKEETKQVTELKCVKNQSFKTMDIEALGSKKLSLTVQED